MLDTLFPCKVQGSARAGPNVVLSSHHVGSQTKLTNALVALAEMVLECGEEVRGEVGVDEAMNPEVGIEALRYYGEVIARIGLRLGSWLGLSTALTLTVTIIEGAGGPVKRVWGVVLRTGGDSEAKDRARDSASLV